jgi:dTDP-4-amino-4,6-dideoxygalactose transaminase
VSGAPGTPGPAGPAGPPAPITVRYVDLARQFAAIEARVVPDVIACLRRGDYIAGAQVAELESRAAGLAGARHAIAVANGTDALAMALEVLGIGPGDEVVTVPNSFVATAGAIGLVGARPVFVDVRDDLNMDPERLEAAIGPRTRAVIPVHLTGRPADMEPILAVARARGLPVIEDAAQAILATYDGRPVGSFGTLACFSLHPLKNWNACGDAGLITTSDADLAARLVRMRNHGLRTRDESERWGRNSRLDTIQAAILLAKLDFLPAWTAARRANAAFYQDRLADVVAVPRDGPRECAVYHTFVIQADRRDDLAAHLLRRGVETRIHYPIPIHLMPAARSLGYGPGSFPRAEAQGRRILSLPVYPELTPDEKEAVVDAIRTFA